MSLEGIRAFLAASEPVEFAGQKREEIYSWVERTLREQDYTRLRRPEKGLVRQYVGKMTGLSRAQVARLVRSYCQKGVVKAQPYERHRFGGCKKICVNVLRNNEENVWTRLSPNS